jgi:hypothetical protein
VVSRRCNTATAKRFDSAHAQLRSVAISRNRATVMALSPDPTQETHMKKNRDSSELAARIAAAASQPAGRSSVPAPTLVSPQPAATRPVPESEAAPSKPKNAKRKEPDTVPITLRPTSALLSKFVLKASERTREEGRVVSAQQIMLEALERSVQ